MCRRRTRIRARARTMSPYACAYGAGGAALFDIVNVQIWTRRRASAPLTRSLPHRERRRDPFVDLQRRLAVRRAAEITHLQEGEETLTSGVPTDF